MIQLSTHVVTRLYTSDNKRITFSTIYNRIDVIHSTCDKHCNSERALIKFPLISLSVESIAVPGENNSAKASCVSGGLNLTWTWTLNFRFDPNMTWSWIPFSGFTRTRPEPGNSSWSHALLRKAKHFTP